jgi:hypothetical protein
MSGLIRLIALVVATSGLAGCQTDGLVGPEADSSAVKPRVIDTPKTRAGAKKDSNKPAAVAQGDAAPRAVVARLDTDKDITGSITPKPTAASVSENAIPAQSLFGNWTLVEDGGGRKCGLILGGVPLGTSYSARAEASCPHAFTAVQSWEIQGDQLVLRNNERRVVGRLQPTGPFRFDGRAESGPAVYLIR